MHMSGNNIVSSPPSTENPAGASASTRSVSTSSVGTACLTPAIFGMRGERQYRVGAEAAPGPGRDVVEDDRHRARVGHGFEVGDDSRFRRPHVVRHDHQRRDRAVDVAQGFGGGDRGARAVGSRADDQRDARGTTRTRARVDDRLLLVVVERGSPRRSCRVRRCRWRRPRCTPRTASRWSECRPHRSHRRG